MLSTALEPIGTYYTQPFDVYPFLQRSTLKINHNSYFIYFICDY